MTLQPDLFKAILSMDAYNRGYEAGINNIGGTGSSIGNALIVSQSNINLGSNEREAGFFALAYNYDGETVISFRGTDYPEADKFRDIGNGWSLGAGITSNPQGQMV